MRLHPLVGLDDLLRKRGRREDLRHKRIRVQRNRRYQLLQLLGSLLYVLLARRGLRRVLLVLLGRQPRTTEPRVTGKPKSACPNEALRTPRHARKCPCSCTSSFLSSLWLF